MTHVDEFQKFVKTRFLEVKCAQYQLKQESQTGAKSSLDAKHSEPRLAQEEGVKEEEEQCFGSWHC